MCFRSWPCFRSIWVTLGSFLTARRTRVIPWWIFSIPVGVHTWHDTHSCWLHGTMHLITDNCNTPRNEGERGTAGQQGWTEDSDAFFTIWFPPGRRVCPPEKDLTVSLALWQEVWITTGGDTMTAIFFRIETNLVVLFLAHISPICPSAMSPAMARVLVGTTSMMVRAWPGARKGSTRPRSSHRELARS